MLSPTTTWLRRDAKNRGMLAFVAADGVVEVKLTDGNVVVVAGKGQTIEEAMANAMNVLMGMQGAEDEN